MASKRRAELHTAETSSRVTSEAQAEAHNLQASAGHRQSIKEQGDMHHQ